MSHPSMGLLDMGAVIPRQQDNCCEGRDHSPTLLDLCVSSLRRRHAKASAVKQGPDLYRMIPEGNGCECWHYLRDAHVDKAAVSMKKCWSKSHHNHQDNRLPALLVTAKNSTTWLNQCHHSGLCCITHTHSIKFLGRELHRVRKLGTLLDLCVSSLRRGHANLLCRDHFSSDDPRRESCSSCISCCSCPATINTRIRTESWGTV